MSIDWRNSTEETSLISFGLALIMVFALCKVCIGAGKRPRMWSLISSVLLFVGANIPLFAKVVGSAVKISGYTK